MPTSLKAVILAGGKGTRMGDFSQEIPKAMLSLRGMPLLEHQLRFLQRYGISDVTLCTGYLSHVIEDYFQDGSWLGMSIRYSIESEPLGTAGSLKEVEPFLDDTFFVIYGDIIFDIDLERFLNFHQAARADVSLFTHPNDHPYDSDLVESDDEGRVIGFHRKPHPVEQYLPNNANAALYLVEPRLLEHIDKGVKADLARDIFPGVLDAKLKVYAYNSPEYVKDIGTPNRLAEVAQDITEGKLARRNLKNSRPAIFLDRDGVINEERGHIASPEDLLLIPGAPSAIKKINDSDYLCIVVTNQPVVARGECSIKGVREIHNKLESELGRHGAKIDRIYFCPHHPEKGFPGESARYKIDCACRKPKTGMIDKAKREMNVDLSQSYIIGDSTRDIEMGRKAGLTTIGVRTGYSCKDGLYDAVPGYMFDNLTEAIDSIC